MSAASDPKQIQEEIDRTRAELGDTVEALAQKADVKRQAKRKIQETKASVADKRDDILSKAKEVSPDGPASAAAQVSEKARANPLSLATVGAFAVGFLIGRASGR